MAQCYIIFANDWWILISEFGYLNNLRCYCWLRLIEERIIIALRDVATRVVLSFPRLLGILPGLVRCVILRVTSKMVQQCPTTSSDVPCSSTIIKWSIAMKCSCCTSAPFPEYQYTRRKPYKPSNAYKFRTSTQTSSGAIIFDVVPEQVEWLSGILSSSYPDNYDSSCTSI